MIDGFIIGSFLLSCLFSVLMYLLTKKAMISITIPALGVALLFQEINEKIYGPDKFYVIALVLLTIYYSLANAIFVISTKKLLR